MMNISSTSDHPWKPHEKLELLTEILKAANVHPDALLPLIRNLPYPSWADMPLPRGRSVHQCQLAYEQMLQMPNVPGFSRTTSLREGLRVLDTIAPKRPYSMDLSATASVSAPHYQEIQPKPSPITPGLMQPPGQTQAPPKKRRGRPPKAETELRRASIQAQAALQPLQPRRELPSPTTNTTLTRTPSVVATQAAQAVMRSASRQGHARGSSGSDLAAERRRARLESLETQRRYSEEEDAQRVVSAATASSVGRSPGRGYPDILLRDPLEGPSTFRAPRGGDRSE